MVKQTVISVNGKKTAYLNEKITKVDKSKYVGYKNPPILNSSVVSVNSKSVCRDSKRNRRKQKIMGIFNSAKSQASESAVVKNYDYYTERGFNIIAFNIGANERFYEGKQESTPITSNKGRISCSKNGSVFFTGTIAGFYQWSPSKQQFIAPPAVKQDNGSDVTDPDAKPTGFVGMYMMASVNCAKSAMELFLEEGDLDLAEKAEEATKKARNLNFLVNQEIAFDLPTTHQVVLSQSQALRSKKQTALKNGKTAGSLQATLVLAVKIDFPKSGIFQPIIKVSEILAWDGEYMPLPLAGRVNVSAFQADELMQQAETLWDEQAASISLEKSMGEAVINLVCGDNAGTTRTKRTNEYRKRNAQKKAQQAAFQASQENVDTSIASTEPQIEEISEDDLDSFGSLGV